MKTKIILWPVGIILAFILFFCGITTVIIIAATHREYLVSDDYYEQEMVYQNRLESTLRARESGACIAYDPVENRIIIGIPARQRAQQCTGTIEFYRPSARFLDRDYAVESPQENPQVIDTSRLPSGLWRVKASWHAAGLDYYMEQKIVIPRK